MRAAGSPLQTFVLTGVALLAFAGNSILCRLALRDQEIDPASFTAIRLLAGAISLFLIFRLRNQNQGLGQFGNWASAAALFLYAICFSFAYVSLAAGTGALILFASVQGTMIGMGLVAGDRPQAVEWMGWCVAFGGMAWLLSPGINAPPLAAAWLMVGAGVAWGVYSMRGRHATDALGATVANFVLALLFVGLSMVLYSAEAYASQAGIVLAVVSGAVTSGAGYVIWYTALRRLSSIQAAMSQLLVPAIAAAGGVLLLAEPLTLRLVIASLLIIGGMTWSTVGAAKKAS